MDSDDEHEQRQLTDPEWRQFEKGVQDLLARLDQDAEVLHNQALPGRLSNTPRQVDVLVRGTIAGQDLVIAVECKRYKRPLGIGAVDEFVGKLIDLGVDRGVLYALSGLTAPASSRATGARQPMVAVGDLAEGEGRLKPDLGAVLTPKFGDCLNENCYTGDVSWGHWGSDRGASVRIGDCDTCGTWAATCPHCDDMVDFVGDESTCWCGTHLALVYDPDGVEVEAVAVTTAGGEVVFTP